MKKSQLQQIIREEISKVLNEENQYRHYQITYNSVADKKNMSMNPNTWNSSMGILQVNLPAKLDKTLSGEKDVNTFTVGPKTIKLANTQVIFPYDENNKLQSALSKFQKFQKLNENKDNYMFFQNLKTIRDAADEMLSLDPSMVDMILSDGHDWANDHIATSKDDVEEVKNFLMNKKTVAEKLKGGQKKLDVAEPKGEITAADFEALRAMKKK
jgi:hypothetical protein